MKGGDGQQQANEAELALLAQGAGGQEDGDGDQEHQPTRLGLEGHQRQGAVQPLPGYPCQIGAIGALSRYAVENAGGQINQIEEREQQNQHQGYDFHGLDRESARVPQGQAQQGERQEFQRQQGQGG